MKKLIFTLAAAGLLAFACTAPDSQLTESIDEGTIIGATYEDIAGEPGTRSTISDDGVFAWSAGDSFQAYSTKGVFTNTFTLYRGAGEASASFMGLGVQGKIKNAAVTPTTLNPSWESDKLYVTYPETIAWVAGEADPYMVAACFDEGASSVQFRHIGGLIKLSLNNVSSSATQLDVTVWGAQITGPYQVDITDKDAPVVTASVAESSTVTFTIPTGHPEEMDFYIPVPAMEYSKIGFALKAGESEIFSFESSEETRTIARKQLKIFPSITLVGGEGEDAGTIEITATEGVNQLPNTTEKVIVNVYATSETVSLVYGTGTAKPETVEVRVCTGPVAELDINLPESTVTVNGEPSANVVNLTAVTSDHTLVVNESAKVESLTINQGNAKVYGEVSNIVIYKDATSDGEVLGDDNQVVLEIFAEAVVKQVNLEVKSDVIVEQPSKDAIPSVTDHKLKVVVEKDESTGKDATGSTATAQNGGQIFVEVQANCEVIATGTDDSGEKKSTVTIASIDDDVDVTAVEGEGGVIDNDSGKDIDTKDYVAKIGNDYYLTLTEAFAAAQNGDTVTLLKDYDATEEWPSGSNARMPIVKSLTFDGGNHNVTVKGRGFAPGMNASSNVDVTFKDITILNSSSAARCIDTRGNIGTLTLDNATLDTQGASGQYTQPLTIGGNQATAANVIIKNGSVIQTNDDATAYYAIITFNPVNMSITGSTITGWAAIYMKGVDGSEGSHGSIVNIDNSTINTRNVYSGTTNAFSAFPLEHSDITINVTNSTLNIHGESNQQSIVSFDNNKKKSNNSTVNLGEGNTVNLTGEGLFRYNDGNETCSLNITGGTFNVDPNKFCAPNYGAFKSNNVWTVVPLTEDNAVAKIGTTFFATLEAAAAAAESGDTITLIKDVDLSNHARSVSDDIILAGVTLDMNNHTIKGFNSGVRYSGTGAVIRNGTFDFVEAETKPNYGLSIGSYTDGATISDNMTIENVNVIGGVNVDLANVTFNNVNINMTDATFYALWVDEDGAVATYNSGTITGGVNATAIFGVAPPLTGVTDPIDIYITGGTILTNGKSFRLGGKYLPVKVSGGRFDVQVPVDCCAEGYEPTTTPDSDGKYTVQEITYVAQIGETKYATLAAAFAAAHDGDTVTLLVDVTQDLGIQFDKENASVKFDLNGNTFTVNTGSNVNSRAIRIDNGTLEVYGGTIVAAGSGTNKDNGSGCYGAFRVEANGVLNAHDLNLTNSRPWGLNVKVLGGVAELTNVNITSSYGGGIEVTEADLGTGSKEGTATLTNCNFTQTGYFDHCSTPLSVSGGSHLEINGGAYTSDNYALYVFSSGGEIVVNDGTFSGNKDGVAIIAAIDTNSYPNYTGGLKIKGGNFSGGYNITLPAYMEITGGTFDHDPSAYVAEGYKAKKVSDTEWIVEESNEVNYTFTAFNKAVVDNNGVFDGSVFHPGKDVVVTISASEKDVFNNNTAQFYLGRGTGDKVNGIESVTIKNVSFKYNHDADEATKVLNTGEVYFVAMNIVAENCTFTENSGLSSWGYLGNEANPPVSMTIKNCTFKNLTGRYAIHQNRAKSLTVTGCTFDNCERGIHTNSPTPVEIIVKNNTFTGIDADKGALCLAENMANAGNATFDITGNVATGQAMLRSLNSSVSATQIANIRDNNTFGTLYTTGSTYKPVE